jgi:hypothetical protein
LHDFAECGQVSNGNLIKKKEIPSWVPVICDGIRKISRIFSEKREDKSTNLFSSKEWGLAQPVIHHFQRSENN